MAKNDPDWEMLRKFRYTAPHRYREICMNYLSNLLDTDPDTLTELFLKVTIFDENRNVYVPMVTHQMVVETEYLIQQLKKNNNLKTSLLFRKPGSKARCNQLRQYLAERRFTEIELGNFTPCDFAVVLKKILQDPEEPLLTSVLYLAYSHIQGMAKKEFSKMCSAVRIIFLMLPEDNYMLMRELLLMLHEVHYLQQFNQMNAHSLAVCLAPSLVCPRQFTVKEFQKNASAAVSTLKFMIENAPELFVIPTQLIIDIRKQMKLTRSGHGSTIVYGKKSVCPSISLDTLLPLSTDKQLTDHSRKLQNTSAKDDCVADVKFKTPRVNNTKSFVRKSSSFFFSTSVEEAENDISASQTSTESQGENKGFFRKLFLEKKTQKSNPDSCTAKRKRWSWLLRFKGKEQDVVPTNILLDSEESETWGSHTYFPSREEARHQLKEAMDQNVIPNYLKVQRMDAIETRLSIAEGHKTQVMRNEANPNRTFLNSHPTVTRNGTFIVKQRSHSSFAEIVQKIKPIHSRRHSTYTIEDHSWSDSLPSIFNSDSEFDEVFPDEMSLLYPFSSFSREDEDFQL